MPSHIPKFLPCRFPERLNQSLRGANLDTQAALPTNIWRSRWCWPLCHGQRGCIWRDFPWSHREKDRFFLCLDSLRLMHGQGQSGGCPSLNPVYQLWLAPPRSSDSCEIWTLRQLNWPHSSFSWEWRMVLEVMKLRSQLVLDSWELSSKHLYRTLYVLQLGFQLPRRRSKISRGHQRWEHAEQVSSYLWQSWSPHFSPGTSKIAALDECQFQFSPKGPQKRN